MPDYRMAIIHSVEEQLLHQFDSTEVTMISDIITKVLNDYEVTERHTELIPYDSVNERILKQYTACLYVDGKSAKTVYQYQRSCIKLAETIQKTFPEMGVYDIRYYLACEKDRGVSNRSIENTRANLSAFFQWMAREEIISKNPCLNIKPIKYPEVIRLPFSNIEIDSLRGHCKTAKERAILEVLLSSGIRVSELSNLNISDIDTETLAVHVREGKGNKERITYITNLAMKFLSTYLDTRSENGDILFYNNQHKRLNAGGIRSILNTLSTRAEVANVHPHRFRRTFATGLAARGMNIQEIKNLLGHSSINTTMEYIAMNDNQIMQSYQRYIA